MLAMVAIIISGAVMAQAPDAPSNLFVRAAGETELVLIWTGAGDSTFVIQVSTDSVTFTSVDTVAKSDTVVFLGGLTAATEYDIHVFELSAAGNGDTAATQGTTIMNKLVTHLLLDEIVNDSIVNSVDGTKDGISSGPVTIVDAGNSGLGKSAMRFTSKEIPPITNWIRLYNTVPEIVKSTVGRTINFWMKAEPGETQAVPISFGKRAGMDIVIKNGMMHAMTGFRIYSSGSTWWADSTGEAFTSNDWTMVTYQFDFPVTRLFINGVLVDESDGKGYYDLTKVKDFDLPWPGAIETNEPSSTTGASAEIGCLFDPNAAMVQYFKDTWDPGVHAAYGFNGLMSDIRMYNCAITDDSIKSLFDGVAVKLADLQLRANGQESLVLRWTDLADETGYEISQSEDGSTWVVAGTLDANAEAYIATGLTPETMYYFKVQPLGLSKTVLNNTISVTTLAEEILVHLPLDAIVNDSIENIVDGTMDAISNGPVSVVDAANSGLGIPAMRFTSTELPPINNWIRLYNTVLGFTQGFMGRTINFWMKPAQGENKAVPISFGKRAGMDIVIKDGMMHAMTGFRIYSSGSTWWADSTGAPYTSEEWTMVTYQFDHPVTRLFINGVLVDESDGKGYYDLTKVKDFTLPWPGAIETNEPVSTTGASAEIGCLFDPNAAMVQYFKDTWDPGVHGGYGFNGWMSDIRMFNFVLTEDSIAKLAFEHLVSLAVTPKAYGPEDITVSWTDIEGETGYKVSYSTDGTTWTEAGTTIADATSHMITGLTEATEYHVKVEPQGVNKIAIDNVVMGTTLTAALVAHLDFNQDPGTAYYVENTVTGERDSTVVGPVSVLGMSDQTFMGDYFDDVIRAISFTQTELPPVTSWVRIYNTLMPAAGAFNHKTISFWMKPAAGETKAVPISFGKRKGMDIVLKDGMLYALTGFRITSSGSSWWVDSTSAVFTNEGWSYITYVFDNPVTKLYVNGVMVAESDGKGYYELVKARDYPLPYPTDMEINEPSSTTGASAEIGSLFDPNAAMVYYFKDTWDPGVHASYAFSGQLADMKFYNYALADADIVVDMMEHVKVGIDELNNNYFNVYPNPASDILFISNAQDAQVAVYDNIGKLVLRTTLNQTNQLDISSLPQGLYYLRISTERATSVVQISIVR